MRAGCYQRECGCVCLGALLALCACRSEVATAAQAAAGHAAEFARFERWAERVAQSDVALRGPQALREATFAPLRADRSVLWAQVRDSTGEPLEYAAPVADDALAFVRVATPELRGLQVAVSPRCRDAKGKVPAQACVVIARPARSAADQSAVRVAFRIDLDAGAVAAK